MITLYARTRLALHLRRLALTLAGARCSRITWDIWHDSFAFDADFLK